MGIIHPYCTHGDHPSLLYTWGPSIPIVHMGTIHPYCIHGHHPSLLYTWGPSIPIVHMGTIHPYCTHGDHPSLLYTWGPSIPIVHMGTIHPYCTHGGPSIPIVHMGTIHPYCTHGDHTSLLYRWGSSIPIVHMGVRHRTLVPMWKWWGPLLPHLLPSSPIFPHPPPPHVKPLVMIIFVLQDGCSPLWRASDKGHLDVVKTLIAAGANTNHTNKVDKCLNCCCTCTCTCTHFPLVSQACMHMFTCMS